VYPTDVFEKRASIDLTLRNSAHQALAEACRGVTTSLAAARLRNVQRALSVETPGAALRQMDSAWRCVSEEDTLVLAPAYGILLALEATDHEATLGMLERARGTTPDADIAALIALTLIRLQRPLDSRHVLEAALSEYCVVGDGLSSRVAWLIAGHPAIDAPGWIGRGPELEWVGQLSPRESSNALEVKIGNRPSFTQLLPDSRHRGAGELSFSLTQFADEFSLEVSSRGVSLLGSGRRLPSDFGLDGGTTIRGCRLTGWARIGSLPTQPPCIRIRDEGGHGTTFKCARRTIGGHRWSFDLDLSAARVRGRRIQIESRLPNGRWLPLPDSPLLLGPAVQSQHDTVMRLPKWGSASRRKQSGTPAAKPPRFVDVIVPVYRGRDESLACLDTVLSTVGSYARIVVVDDATDEPLLAAALDELAARGRIELLRNAENRGFVQSVNRGLALNPTHDAVILNSDTLVFGDWLRRLRKAAYRGRRVGTVTPLSNSGSIASYPNRSGGAIDSQTSEALQALAASTHSGKSIEIPVGVGFCLYMRRDCLRDVGGLDADVFDKGYGEETDYCLRARRRGWSHRLAADVFVYHAGGLSFGARRARLLERSQRLLNLRYPGYDAFIAGFLSQDPIQPLRRTLDERRLLGLKGRLALLVTLALTGGVDRFVNERGRILRGQGLIPLLLRPVVAGDVSRCELWTEAIDLPNLRYEIPTALDSLTALLRSLPLESVEIQHFLHLDPKVIDAVRALPVPYDVFVHDYAWVCPRITLIDGSGRYCGEPAIAVCQRCVKRNGTTLGEAISVPALRARSGRWLNEARRVVAPSSDTAKRLQQYFRGLDVAVTPHSPRIERVVPAPRRSPHEVTRVALIGAIGGHKGYGILLDCARNARLRGLPVEFVVIGYTEDDAPLLATGKVFITGRYGECEVAHLVERERPDIVFFPSVWPETWCYALDHALHAGLPVVAFELGAIAERLRAVSGCVLLPLTLEPARINDLLLEVSARAENPAAFATYEVQTQMSPAFVVVKMGRKQPGEATMKKTPDSKPEQTTREDGVGASVQVLPLPPGLYLFSVKAATPVVAAATGQLSLPAVHVGLGPGVRTEEVEFVAGPSTHGGWLFATGDLLVTKVNGAGATLVLTSVRAPGGEILSIKVERLEARADALAGQATAGFHERTSRERGTPAKLHAGRGNKVPAGCASDETTVPLQIGAHVRTRGDMSFFDVPWAGRVAPGLWLESFSVRPLERFVAQDIEYKGLTGSGFETPWLSDDKMCGTQGMSTPLLGFAIRLKPSLAAAAYDCEYSGCFASGLTVGPLRNGVPCRSSVASDPLEGIQLRLVKRSTTILPGLVERNAEAKSTQRKRKSNAPTGRNVSGSTRLTRRTSAHGP
jgi:GT2 family glycosyltransferase/glycosyltransferase involved in cell wall biosynthesis